MRSDGTESPVVVEQKGEDCLVSDIFTEILLEILHLDRLHLCG